MNTNTQTAVRHHPTPADLRDPWRFARHYAQPVPPPAGTQPRWWLADLMRCVGLNCQRCRKTAFTVLEQSGYETAARFVMRQVRTHAR